MQAYQVISDQGLPDALQRIELDDPSPGHGEVLIRVRATALNYRDTIIVNGGYPRNDTRPVIPLSDGAGEVIAVGDGVDRWQPGDRVAANFLRDWIRGPVNEAVLDSSLGGGLDGMLAEQVVMPEQSLVAMPDSLSFEQAATLPCAGVTAWNALSGAGIQAGDTVLLLGTGGVSIFGLQLAKACGARVIITSSSDEKLAQAKAMGADETINYRQQPDWQDSVRELTGGRGADLVLEVGGPGTLERSLQAVRAGGHIAMIGLLTEGQPSVLPLLLNAQTMRGIYVGSVELFESLMSAVTVNGIEPHIDRVFEFDQALEAYQYFSQQQHIGKVVIRGS